MFFCKGPFWSEGRLRGSVLFVVIGAVIVMSLIGTALSRLHGFGTETEMQENRSDAAYYAAISGVQYFSALTDANRETFKSGSESSRTLALGGCKFLITNIGSDSDSWYIDVIGSYTVGGVKSENYILKNITIARTSKKTGPTLHDENDSIGQSGSGSSTVRTTDDVSETNNDGVVKGSSTSGVALSSTAIDGKSYLFSSSYRGRVVHSFVEDYNIFYKGTIMVFLYPNSLSNSYAGIVHKGISRFVCNGGIFSDEVYTLQFWPGGGSSLVYKMFLIEGTENTSCGKTDQDCLCTGSNSWRYVEATSGSKVVLKEWQHVAITWEEQAAGGLIMKFYINGVLDSTTTVGKFTPRRNQADLVIGGQSDDNSGDKNTFYDGYMDDMIIYNRALSSDEIKSYFDEKMKSYCTGSHKKETICN